MAGTRRRHREVFVPASPRGPMRYVDQLAGQAGAQTNLKLTCQLDHSVGAEQSGRRI